MHMFFKIDCLILDTHWSPLPLRRYFFPSCQHPFLLGEFSIGLKLQKFSPGYISMSTCFILLQLGFKQSCWGDFVCRASVFPTRVFYRHFLYNISLTIFQPLPLQWCVSLRCKKYVMGVVEVRTELHTSAFWLDVVFLYWSSFAAEKLLP